MMKKVVFLSCIPTPHWLRFVPYIRKFVDARFYYYESGDCGRPNWWVEGLGEFSCILPKPFVWRYKYFTLAPIRMLRKERPQILVLSGFSDPSNYLAYLWARRHHCKTVVLTERSRDKTGKLRPYDWKWRLLRFLYRKVDKVMLVASGGGVENQFIKTFKFGDKVYLTKYPAVLDPYFAHPLRSKKDAYTIIHANSLTSRYNPICSIRAFSLVLKEYPKTKLLMNADGPMRSEVEEEIRRLGLQNSVTFLDGIKSFDDLDAVYAASDIMILPATRSNGNYTVAECMASGIACVLSKNVPCRNESEIRANNSVWFLPPEPQDFSEKICYLIEHPDEFSRVGRFNRGLVRPRTMQATAEEYNQLFQTL